MNERCMTGKQPGLSRCGKQVDTATPIVEDVTCKDCLGKKGGYLCFYGPKQVEVWALTTWQAKELACKLLNVPAKKQYLVSVHLCQDVDGKEVVQGIS